MDQFKKLKGEYNPVIDTVLSQICSILVLCPYKNAEQRWCEKPLCQSDITNPHVIDSSSIIIPVEIEKS